MSKFVQAGDLDQKVQVLQFTESAPGKWAWQQKALSWARAEYTGRRTVFSESAKGAPAVVLTMRHHPSRTRRTLLQIGAQALMVCQIKPMQGSPGYVEITAAEVRVLEFRAEPQKRTGRDNLNRPTAVDVPAFTFPGVLTEQYHRNEESEIYRSDVTCRVLVTPPEIRLRSGDIVRVGEQPPYVVRTVGDLDPDRIEYLIEREADI